MVVANKVGAPWTTIPSAKIPVTGVLWAEAVNYCALKYPAGGRLPTEEEWEAAARGLKARRYPWGDTPDIAAANTESARRDAPAAVGSFPRGGTPDGVQDLIGNVWEWTSSEPRAYPAGKAFPPSSVGMRVIRGGAFDTPDSIATPWWRGYSNPAASRSDLAKTGFRCARDK
jgi:iron(II)-dependent oxidoreductase